MLQLTLKQVFDLSGVYDDDSDLVKDMKLRAWIGNRSYQIVTQDADTTQAIDDGIEILIIKES